MFTSWVSTLLTRQHRARRAMRRKQILAIPPGIAAVCPCRARPNQRLGPFVPSKGAQAPLEPRHSPLPGTPITALASVFNYRF